MSSGGNLSLDQALVYSVTNRFKLHRQSFPTLWRLAHTFGYQLSGEDLCRVADNEPCRFRPRSLESARALIFGNINRRELPDTLMVSRGVC